MDRFGGVKIDKLRGENFHVWKQKIQLLLALKGLDEHLESTPPLDEALLSKWKQDDAKARAVIGLTEVDNYLDHTRGWYTATEMWKAICDVFQQKTLLKHTHARRAFYSARMRDDGKILPFINRVGHLASDMEAMGVDVQEEDVTMSILCCLPEQYELLIEAVNAAVGDRDLSLDFV